MGLDIWFKDDLANVLRAANEANLSALAATARASDSSTVPSEQVEELRRAYREGFVAALVTLALALGLPAELEVGSDSILPVQWGRKGTERHQKHNR